jgi:hypothetical protein
VNSGYYAIWKRGGVEACRLMRFLVEPEADRVFWLHLITLLFVLSAERRQVCALTVLEKL